MTLQTTVTTPYIDPKIHERYLLETTPQWLVVERFGNKRTVPTNQGDIVEFVKVPDFDVPGVAQNPLPETSAANPQSLNYSTTTAQIMEYGAYVEYTYRLWKRHNLRWDAIIDQKFSKQVAGVRNYLIHQELLTNAGNKIYAPYPTATSTSTVNATISAAEVDRAIHLMRVNHAPRVTKALNPVNKYKAEPVQAGYFALIRPEVASTVEQFNGFTPYRYYQDRAKEFAEYEIGEYRGIRFLMVDWLPKIGTNSGGADVYGTIILGAEAFGMITFNKEAFRYLETTFAAEKGDPHGRWKTKAWSMEFATKVLYPEHVVVIEHLI